MIGAAAHEKAGCQNGYLCNGPRCRVLTGKTERKQNWKRPKANKHEGTRAVVTEGKKKK